MILQHGTEEQKQRYLPRMATGEIRGAFSMSEPGLGSDVAAIRTKAVRDGDSGVDRHGPEDVADQRWVGSNLVAVLVRTDLGESESPYKNMTHLPHREGVRLRGDRAGRHRAGQDREDGLQGRRHDRADLRGAPHDRCAAARRSARQGLLPDDGRGRGGPRERRRPGLWPVARAFELGIAYSQQRETFGKKIAEHQGILFRLADMATKVEASHQMMVKAAKLKDAGERNDLEAGMAKYLASENCADVVEQSFRIHGGYGYSKEYEIERLYREAPMLLIGEGTAEIQKMIIGRRLLEDYKAR
jgi:alkylation response protein AidB-like acyl-CoA dehydrogenase